MSHEPQGRGREGKIIRCCVNRKFMVCLKGGNEKREKKSFLQRPCDDHKKNVKKGNFYFSSVTPCNITGFRGIVRTRGKVR